MKSIKINDEIIDKTSLPYIIAEIGSNHCGSLDICWEMVTIAARCGVDAVKLQARDNDRLFTEGLLSQPYINENSYGDTYGEHRKALDWAEIEPFLKIKTLCKRLGTDFIVTAFEENSAKMLGELQPSAVKVASCDFNNPNLIKELAKLELPLILSCGGAKTEDHMRLAELELDNFAVLHCISNYPCTDEELNLSKIKWLDGFYDCPIGFSSHHPGLLPNYLAYMLGARIFEVHFTLNRASKGTDHAFSLEPDGLRRLCADLKRIPTMMISEKPNEKEQNGFLRKFGKSWYPKEKIVKGQEIWGNHLELRAPADGFKPWQVGEIIGKCARHDIDVGKAIDRGDLI